MPFEETKLPLPLNWPTNTIIIDSAAASKSTSVPEKKNKSHACLKCDYSTRTASQLKLHVKAVHDRIKDYQCWQCSYVSSHSGDLKRHVRGVHDKFRPYRCSQCQKPALNRSDLLRHVKAVHGRDLNELDGRGNVGSSTSSSSSKANEHGEHEPDPLSNDANVMIISKSKGKITVKQGRKILLPSVPLPRHEVNVQNSTSQVGNSKTIIATKNVTTTSAKPNAKKIIRKVVVNETEVANKEQADTLEEKKANISLQIEAVKKQISDLASKKGSNPLSMRLKLSRAKAWTREYKEVHEQQLSKLPEASRPEAVVKYVNLLGLIDDMTVDVMSCEQQALGNGQAALLDAKRSTSMNTKADRFRHDPNDVIEIDCDDELKSIKSEEGDVSSFSDSIDIDLEDGEEDSKILGY